MEKCRAQLKAAEEVAESRGIRLFHSLKKSKEYVEAEELYQNIVKGRDPTSSEDIAILDLSHSYAAMLVEQKKFQEAEPVSRAVWEKRKECPGPPSEIIKESHRQLCSILCALGKLKDAENMYRSMYQSEMTDAWTLENGDEMCKTLKKQGEIKRAKDMQEEVWNERLKHLGARDGLTTRSGLRLVGFLEELVATIDKEDGTDAERRRNVSHKEAYKCEIEVVLRKIWDTRPQPGLTTDILEAGHKLGVLVFRQDKFPDAEAIFILVWEGKKQQLGDRNASTISTGSILGKSLCRQEEQETYRRAVDILRDIYQIAMTTGDSNAISVGEDLAQAYCSIGEWPNAEGTYRGIVQQKNHKRSPAREIEDAHFFLGQTLYKQGMGKNREAEMILGRLYQQWNASSPDYSKTLECGYMLAQLLSAQEEKVPDALKVALDVFNGRRASMERGVAFLDSGYLYGSLLFKTGKHADAERILESAWEHQAGPEEQKVRLKCGHLLGEVLVNRHKYTDAKRILEAVAEAQEADSAGVHEMAETRNLLDEVNRLKKAKDRGRRNSGRHGFLFRRR